MNEIKISTPFIKLDQLIKFAGISYDGAEAKEMIKSGLVKLNGNTEMQRGKKIYPGDVVEIELEELFVLKVV